MFIRISVIFLLGLLLPFLTVFGQEPPMPPETPAQPQDWWPTQPSKLTFVHTLFTSDMVLQRDIAAPIWGWTSLFSCSSGISRRTRCRANSA